MLRLPLIAAVAFSAVAATLTSAEETPLPAPAFAPVTDIEWTYAAQARDDDGEPYLRLVRDGMTSTIGADNLPDLAQALAPVASARVGEAVSFALAREAGAMACTGTVTVPGRAAGTCRFDPDQGFIAALAARGLVPEDVEELLGLALVDARLASIDELARAGFTVADVDELMAVSALEVSGGYAAELRGAGLEPADLDELVSARAVGVEPGWVAGMADAGYAGLDLDKAIELRALSITPDYARRMARVIRGMEGAE